MIKRAYAKINLLLSVVGLDPSTNYHFLQMVSQKINLNDIVKIKISNENRLIFHKNVIKFILRIIKHLLVVISFEKVII